jgi:hypothetical protein
MDHFQSLQQVFSQTLLRIPDYQRGYAWEEKHWQALWDDLDVLDVGAEHYTGTLVLHPSQSDPTTVTTQDGQTLKIYDIVDGQQRMTTLVILLDAIRRELETIPARKALADGLKRTYIATLDTEGQPHVKLTLNSDTRDFFERHVIADAQGNQLPSIQSSVRLAAAKKFFARLLQDNRKPYGDDKFNAWLLDLVKKITSGLKLTVYEVKQEADVGVIFEVMNNRGKILSEMEKVKNYLLYLVSKIPLKAAPKLGQDINHAWSNILGRLMASHLGSSGHENQLLRSHWITVYDPDARNWAGVDSVKEHFPRLNCRTCPAEIVEGVRKYVTTLDDFAVAYCELFSPGSSTTFGQFSDAVKQKLQHAVNKLVKLGVQVSFLPLFAAIRMKLPSDAASCLSYLELCEKYAFRIIRFHERRANAGQSWLFRQGNALYAGRTTLEEVLPQMSATLLYYSPQTRFREELTRQDDWYNWYGIKYFLYEYEEYLAHKAGLAITLPWQQFVVGDRKKPKTIEHILPQTPTPKYWQQRWTAEQRKRLTHDVGNLCITFDNSSYGNKAFPDKRGAAGQHGCYANSTLHMEKALCAHSDWTETELLARRKEMVEWALKRWHVEPAAVEVGDLGRDEEPATAVAAEEAGTLIEEVIASSSSMAGTSH